MICEVGIYAGSFDPPHHGHLEAVNCALQSMASVTIIYRDECRLKPFQSSDKVRKNLLKTMFEGMQNVIISKKSYQATLMDLLMDPTVNKIYQIASPRILEKPQQEIESSTKLSYFIIPRIDYPLTTPISNFNNLSVKIYEGQLVQQHHSSSQLRSQLFEKNFQSAKQGLHSDVFEQILHKHLYISTENEHRFCATLQEVKKTVTQEIITKKLISKEQYPLSFHVGSDIGMSGLSGDVVCFIKDKNKHICLVVKIFVGNDHKSNYDSEIVGYKTIEKLDLKLVKVPTLFFWHQRENFSFIGMSFAAGKSLAHLMHDSPEAVRLCARANLELHLAQRSVATNALDCQIAIYERAIKTVVSKLSEMPTSLFPSDIISMLVDRWSQIHNSFIANPGLLSFTHGDPNHSNWIVDLDNNCVTYIDLSLFKHSISSEGLPCGFAINELEESLLTFWVAARCIGGFSNEKIQEIQEIYKNEYMIHAPEDVTTPEAKHYFASYWTLRVMESLLSKISEAVSLEVKLKNQSHLLNKINQFLNHIN